MFESRDSVRGLQAFQIELREFFAMVVESFHSRAESIKFKVITQIHLNYSIYTPISLITRNSSKSKNIIWLITATTCGSLETKRVSLAKYWIIACESVTTNPSASTKVGTWCCLFIAKNCGVKCSLFSKSIFFNYNWTWNYYVISHQAMLLELLVNKLITNHIKFIFCQLKLTVISSSFNCLIINATAWN